MTSADPYKTLGLSPTATDAEVRSAYRRLVKLHHPDHNNGSHTSEKVFEEVQDAYAQIRELRKQPRSKSNQPPPRRPRTASTTPPVDPGVDARMADLERELRKAHETRERARKAAREAAATTFKRPTDEELGYVTTDDSFSKIIADARSELSGRLSEASEHPVVQRVSSLIDELEELVSKGLRDRRGS